MTRPTLLILVVFAAAGCMRDAVSEPSVARAAESSETEGTAAAPGALVDIPEQAEEYGAVRWGRDLPAALATSQKTGKPLFLLFTEVPGCSTVRGFANGPLRHPLIVEAIETEFVPVVVRNNVGGDERKVLKSFGEPAWNNPVVRFLDHNRKDIAARYASQWTEATLVDSMVRALRGHERAVPGYLSVLHQELHAKTETTLFSMYCFWSGEVALSSLDGVVATRAGFANGREIVAVTWDTDATSLQKLTRQAAKIGAASSVVAQTDEEEAVASRVFDDVVSLRGEPRWSAKDDKYQLRQRELGWVPMTAAQATQVNRAAVRSNERVESYLSPRQMAHARAGEHEASAGPLRSPNATR